MEPGRELPDEVRAAFGELGLAAGTPSGELRRAYLRAVKQRKPEVDPEGFRRAREAFELLARWFSFQAQLAAGLNAGPPPDAGPGPVVAPEPALQPAAPPAEAAPPAPPREAEGWLAVGALVNGKRFAEACALVRTLLRDGPPVEPAGLLRMLLHVQARHPGPDVRQTLGVFVERVEYLQRELSLGLPPERWLLVKELARLPEATPPELEANLAAAVGAGDLGALRGSLEALPGGPDQRQRLQGQLEASAPLLARLVAPRPAPRPRVPDPAPPPGSRTWMYWAALLAVMTLAMSGVCNPGPERAGPVPAPSFAPSPRAPATRVDPVTALCVYAAALCPQARRLQGRLDAHDCPGAQQALTQLVQQRQQTPLPPELVMVDRALVDFQTRLTLCGPL